jgi:hypothetical protein
MASAIPPGLIECLRTAHQETCRQAGDDTETTFRMQDDGSARSEDSIVGTDSDQEEYTVRRSSYLVVHRTGHSTKTHLQSRTLNPIISTKTQRIFVYNEYVTRKKLKILLGLIWNIL